MKKKKIVKITIRDSLAFNKSYDVLLNNRCIKTFESKKDAITLRDLLVKLCK